MFGQNLVLTNICARGLAQNVWCVTQKIDVKRLLKGLVGTRCGAGRGLNKPKGRLMNYCCNKIQISNKQEIHPARRSEMLDFIQPLSAQDC